MKVVGCGGCRLDYAWRHNGSGILCQELANGQCPLHALNRSVRALCSLSMNDVDGMSVEADAERCCRIGCSIEFARHATARTPVFRERPLSSLHILWRLLVSYKCLDGWTLSVVPFNVQPKLALIYYRVKCESHMRLLCDGQRLAIDVAGLASLSSTIIYEPQV